MVTLVNRAKVATSSTGTGTITLGAAESGYQSFADAGVVNSDVVRYTIEDGDAWEIGSGTYSSGTLTRVLDESSTGSLLNLSGDAVVYVTAADEDIQQPPSEGPFVDGDKTKLDGIEAGATADQTAGEIKTAYESNANTNAFTDTEQTKLAGIEATADVTDAGNVNPLVDAHLNTSSATTGEYLSWTGSDYDWVAVSGYTDADVDTHLNTGTAVSGEVLSWNGSDYDWITSGGAFSVIGTRNLAAIATLPALTTGTDNFAAGNRAADNLTTGSGNVAIGRDALYFTATTVTDNVSIGTSAGFGSTSIYGVNIGGSAGYWNQGAYNIGIGYQALYGDATSKLTGARNVGIGDRAGVDLSTGANNFLGGYQAGTNLTTGSNNVALGNGALDAATTGGRNIAIGQDAMGSGVATTAFGDNIAIGYQAGYDLTNGNGNVLIGRGAGDDLTSGGENVLIGFNAGSAFTSATGVVAIGRRAALSATGNESIAIGQDAQRSATGTRNIALGVQAAYSTTSGNNNISIGYNANYGTTTGTQNTTLGNFAQGITTGSNNTIIGYSASPSASTVSNEITLGSSSITRFRIPGAGIDNTSAALSGTTPSVDVGARDTYTLTTSGNTTFTFTGVPSSGQVGTFSLIITAGGTHTLTWPASVDWAGGTAPDAPASGEKDIYTFMTVDGGTTWYGFLAGDAMA